MDAAASVAGLISLALEITKVTYSYTKDVHDAPKEASEFHSELCALKQSLVQLQEFLQRRKARQTFTNTSTLLESTVFCEKELNYLKPRLDNLEKVYKEKKLFRRMAWPFKKEEHVFVLRRIKDYTQIFNFSVSLEGWYVLYNCGNVTKYPPTGTNG